MPHNKRSDTTSAPAPLARPRRAGGPPPPRHYGGEYECVHLSARTGKGIDDLLTTIVLASDILELKANPDRHAIGTIVDAHLERGRGPVATVLVQAGTPECGGDIGCGIILRPARALACVPRATLCS